MAITRKEQFFELLGEHDKINVAFYVGQDLPAMLKMNVVSVEDYDDEIVVRGDGGEFIILPGDPVFNEEDEEYIFGKEIFQIGIKF